MAYSKAVGRVKMRRSEDNYTATFNATHATAESLKKVQKFYEQADDD